MARFANDKNDKRIHWRLAIPVVPRFVAAFAVVRFSSWVFASKFPSPSPSQTGKNNCRVTALNCAAHGHVIARVTFADSIICHFIILQALLSSFDHRLSADRKYLLLALNYQKVSFNFETVQTTVKTHQDRRSYRSSLLRRSSRKGLTIAARRSAVKYYLIKIARL